MSIAVTDEPIVVRAAQSVALSTLLQIAPSSANPSYLVLNAFDRDEYSAGASGATGTLNGAGAHVGLAFMDGDAREAGIVFSYQSSTGRYYNASLGYLDHLTYTASGSAGDITDLSLYGTSNQALAMAYANDTYALMQVDPAGYLGTAEVATLPGFAGPVPPQATPNAIAAIAEGFVHQDWNQDGCWTLASAIAAEAGASLPLTSTANVPGQANGEWFVAYDGPAGSTGNWQSMVRAGDMIGFVTAQGGGHITTCVSGSGASAELVDNEVLVDSQGRVLNPANDGSADDIVIEAPHLASQEWSGVSASSVVIYRLDTPVVTPATGAISLVAGLVDGLASLFSAADPAGRPITEYQVFGTNAGDPIMVNGVAVAAVSAATAVTVGSLASVTLAAGQTAGTDGLDVRAFNGAYWGDWTSLSVATTPGTTATPTAPATAQAATAAITSDATSIYRFFDTADGTHFFTASTTERDSLIATHASMVFEGTAFYEDATPVAGDSAVYRFFDTAHGTHLYTESAAEQATIMATRPDLTPEGIAFYAPSMS